MLKKQFLWSLFYKILSMTFVLLIPYYLVQILSEYEYGKWSVFQSFIMWFFLMDLGIGNSLINLLPKEGKYKNRLELLTTVNFLNLIISLLIFIILGFVSLFYIEKQYIYALMLLVVFFPYNIVGKYYIYKGRSEKVELLSLLSNILFFMVVVFMYKYKNDNIEYMVYLYIVTLTIPKIVYFNKSIELKYSLKRTFFFIKFITLKNIRKIVNLSIPLFLAQVIYICLLTSIRYIFAYNDLYQYAGLFDLLFRPGSIIIMLFVLLLRPIWAKISSLYNHQKFSDIRKLVLNIFLLYFSISILVFISTKLGVFSYLLSFYTKNYSIMSGINLEITILFVMIVILHNIISYIMNGLSLVKEQVYLNFFGVLLVGIYFFILDSSYQYYQYLMFFIIPFLFLIFFGLIFILNKLKVFNAKSKNER